MKRSTIDLLNKKLGRTTGATSSPFSEDMFTTGEKIHKECEAIEHLIEEEGVEAFLERAGKIIFGDKNIWRKEDAGNAGTDPAVETNRTERSDQEDKDRLRKDEAEDTSSAKPNT